MNSFVSSPIVASTENEARQILGRTYQAPDWALKRYKKERHPFQNGCFNFWFTVIRIGGAR
jgi:hypothetical protein